MTFNKWTLGLVAVGAISMTSAVRAKTLVKFSEFKLELPTSKLLDETAKKEISGFLKAMKSSENCQTVLPTQIPILE